MKALLVTGTLAENTVRQYAKQSKTPTEVVALKTQVAAFLTPQTISNSLKKMHLTGIDVILTPGQILGDTKNVTEALKIPTFKGPRYAADLPTVLDLLPEVKLSTVVPACDLLRETLRQKALEQLDKVEADRDVLLKKPGTLLIGDLAIGKEFPMRVLAEVVDAPLLETAEIQRQARRYVKEGANFIDVGMLAGQSRLQDVRRAVEAVKAVVDVPVSIDTLDPDEIKAAVEAGVNLILSADAGNLEAIAPFARDVAVVVIPTNQRRGYFPRTVQARVRLLERLVKKAKQLGFRRIIGDLVLEPTNIGDSFTAIRKFSQKNPTVPLLAGIANVVELFDADSVGLNALLARLCSEVNVDVLLVTEKSPKTRGSVREASVAAKMMFLAKKRDSVPHDLGLDLLVLKDKAPIDFAVNFDLDAAVVAEVGSAVYVADPCGVFRVAVDYERGCLVALHYAQADAEKPSNVVIGADAASVVAEVLRRGLVSRLEHAAYLGRELAKAEVALRLGKGYVQDAEFFR